MREQLAQAAKPKTKGPDPSSAAGLAEAAEAEKANSAVAKVILMPLLLGHLR